MATSICTKDLRTVDSIEFQQFLSSFDNVVLDCDGVILHLFTPIVGTKDSIQALRNMKKNIYFVSNNCSQTLKIFHDLLSKYGFGAQIENIIIPTVAIIQYLKDIKFDKKIFLIGNANMRTEFESAGFAVADKGPSEIDETVPCLKRELVDDPSVGAVVFDVDVNLNFIRLSKALIYLQRQGVHFIIAATDYKIPMGGDNFLIGPAHFQDMLQKLSNKTPEVFGKPSINLSHYMQSKFQITNPSRTLFIGDSLKNDMGFASYCGYRKLLVLSGVTKREDLHNIKDSKHRPDYYLDCLSDLNELIVTNTLYKL